MDVSIHPPLPYTTTGILLPRIVTVFKFAGLYTTNPGKERSVTAIALKRPLPPPSGAFTFTICCSGLSFFKCFAKKASEAGLVISSPAL